MVTCGCGMYSGYYKKPISFLDSDYAYDSSYYPKLKTWLQQVTGSRLNVFAYNGTVSQIAER